MKKSTEDRLHRFETFVNDLMWPVIIVVVILVGAAIGSHAQKLKKCRLKAQLYNQQIQIAALQQKTEKQNNE